MQLKQNLHVIGSLNFHDYDVKGILERLPSERIPTDIGKPVVHAPSSFLCSECNCNGITDVCQQCSVPYCRDCFNKLHSQGKAFRRHRLIPYQMKTSDQGDQPSHCPVHVNEELGYFCVDCRLQTCVQCNSENHTGHEISTMILEVRWIYLY